MTLDNMIIPAVMCGIILYGIWNKIDIFTVFLEGAREGFKTSVAVLPALVALMTCVGMFKASGALDYVTALAGPFSKVIGLPPEVVPLAVLRPVSGSGAIAIYKDILERFGPDSFIGRVASVMEGSSETTFYTIAVYFGAAGVAKTRHTLSASLTADVMVVFMSVVMVRFFF